MVRTRDVENLCKVQRLLSDFSLINYYSVTQDLSGPNHIFYICDVTNHHKFWALHCSVLHIWANPLSILLLTHASSNDL